MAAKKKTEEIVEEVKAEVVEEKPKAKKTTAKKTAEPKEDLVVEEKPKKTTKKTEPKVEEPKVEEPKIEEPKVEEPKVEEPKTEPKVEKPVEVKKEFEPYKAIVSASVLNVRKGPGLSYAHIRDVYAGARINVVEVSGNWGRIGADKWININYIKKV